MLGPPRLRSSAHQYVHRLICRGLGPSLLHGSSVLLLLLLADRFHLFHDSVGTTTRVADVNKTMAPAKSFSPKKDPKSSKPSLTKGLS